MSKSNREGKRSQEAIPSWDGLALDYQKLVGFIQPISVTPPPCGVGQAGASASQPR
jgi:hypothetical protein